MNSRALLNVVLVLAVVVLAAVVYFEPGTKEEPVAPLLTTLNPQQVKELRLSNEQGDVVLQRVGEQWQLQQPLVIAANKFRVDRLLHWLTVSSVQSYAVVGLELSKFGLDQPQSILVADGLELRFGHLDPLNHRRYLLLNDHIHLVAESDLTAPTSPWNYFVASTVVPTDAHINGIVIPGLGELTLGDKGWQYIGKIMPPSADAMQALVDSWNSAQALSVAPAAPSKSHERVVITFADERPALTLMLIRGDDELVLAPEGVGIEYHLGGELGAMLLHWAEPEKKREAE